ncbi:MAG TPA: DUF1801 domain-containing protein [Bacteroidia bacterium]|jgi:hypothetical protein|nr:DUF1801 domain-containing protein [Bacteroidia bacterium]
METKDHAEIFDRIKKEIKKYSTKINITKESGKGIETYTKKPLTVGGKTYPCICFASSLIFKGHVGFYLFTLYTHPEFKKEIPSELLKTLKGKTCFNIKKLDDKLLKQISDTLKKAFEFYKAKGIV